MQHLSTQYPPAAAQMPRLAWAWLCHGAVAACSVAAAVAIAWLPQNSRAQTGPLQIASAPAAAASARNLAALPPQTMAAPGALAHEQLFERARQWVMSQQQLTADQVQFANLDSRVRITECAQPLQFDYPFSVSFETIRVRCMQPVAWQLFLRLTGPAASARPMHASTASNPVAAPRPAGAVAQAAPATKTTVVARQLLQRGTELNASMLEEVQRPALGLDPLAISSLKDIHRAEVVRDIPAGTVLRSYDIKRTLMVRKGQAAMLTVGQGAGFQITVRVEAEQDGYLGEQIRLKNTESGRLISGVVTGPNALKGL